MNTRWRARWRGEVRAPDVPDTAAGEDAAERYALLVRQGLASLPPRQRAVLVLRYCEDLPTAQVASLLGCSAGTVKAHAHSGLRALARATRRAG